MDSSDVLFNRHWCRRNRRVIDVLQVDFAVGGPTDDLIMTDRRDIDEFLRASYHSCGSDNVSAIPPGADVEKTYPSGVSRPQMLIRPPSRRMAQAAEPPGPAGMVQSAKICPSSFPVLISLVSRLPCESEIFKTA